MLDKGLAINVINNNFYKKLKKLTFIPAPFNLKMANNQRCHPLRVIYNLPILLSVIKYLVDVVVLRKEDSKVDQPMILVQPWLQAAWVKQNWVLKKEYIKVEGHRAVFKIGTCPVADGVMQPELLICMMKWAKGLSKEEENTFSNATHKYNC